MAPSAHARSQGTGLGLSIVEQIVDGHGGDITVDSAPGARTSVSFTIRAAGPRPS